MARENSFSDSDGRSLTPDLDEELEGPPPRSPAHSTPPSLPPKSMDATAPKRPSSLKPSTKTSPSVNVKSPTQPGARPTFSTPLDRFRSSVRKVMQLHRTSSMIAGRQGAGAEPGVDPRRSSAFATYGHIKQNCLIDIADYSSVRSSFGRMTNQSFIDMM